MHRTATIGSEISWIVGRSAADQIANNPLVDEQGSCSQSSMSDTDSILTGTSKA